MAAWIDAVVTDLDAGLGELVDEKAKEWWQRYLKGEASCRGVKMADTRRVVNRLWSAHDLDARPIEDVLALCHACFERADTEDKLAGILLLAEHALHDLRIDHVPALSRPLVEGHIADWNTCDWYCVKVLGPMVEVAGDPRGVATAISSWRTGSTLWQRRAAAVSFVNLAPRGDAVFAGFTDLLISVCEANVADPTRWSQTSVGWLLRELSGAAPDRVRDFVAAHPEMSPESSKAATARL